MIDPLVQKLSSGIQEISIGLDGIDNTEIETRLKSGYVHIKFLQTQGGTEIGMNVDPSSLNLSDIDFTNAQGMLHIEGTTNLNGKNVRIIADIDMKSKRGKGHLKIVS